MSSGTYYPFAELNNNQIDLRWDKERIERFIRAVSFPPISLPWIEIDGKKFQIFEMKEDNSGN